VPHLEPELSEQLGRTPRITYRIRELRPVPVTIDPDHGGHAAAAGTAAVVGVAESLVVTFLLIA